MIAKHLEPWLTERTQKIRRWPVSRAEGGASTIAPASDGDIGAADITMDGETFMLHDGDVVIAAITSCTNTSNPE